MWQQHTAASSYVPHASKDTYFARFQRLHCNPAIPLLHQRHHLGPDTTKLVLVLYLEWSRRLKGRRRATRGPRFYVFYCSSRHGLSIPKAARPAGSSPHTAPPPPTAPHTDTGPSLRRRGSLLESLQLGCCSLLTVPFAENAGGALDPSLPGSCGLRGCRLAFDCCLDCAATCAAETPRITAQGHKLRNLANAEYAVDVAAPVQMARYVSGFTLGG